MSILKIDAQKEISTYMQDGKYYLLTQKGNFIYKHQIDISGGNGNFVVINKNANINNDMPGLTGDIALLEDRTNAACYVYATSYQPATNTLDLIRYAIGQSPVDATILATINGAFGSADLQISQKADKLLVEYYTALQNPVTLSYQAALKVYNLTQTWLPDAGLPNRLSLTGQTPAQGPAVFSASGNTVYYRDENKTDGHIYSVGLTSGNNITPISNVTGKMLTAYNNNTYLNALHDNNLYHWQEGQTVNTEPVTNGLIEVLPQLSIKTGTAPGPKLLFATRFVGQKYYELKDHLGNVRATISDLRTMQSSLAQANVESYNNYYPFGMLMPGRNYSSENYRYGFNGKEMDNDMSGGTTGAVYDYGFRIYDSRIGKFLSVDPLTQSYPWYTPYQFAGNKPIKFIDLDGLEEKPHKYDFNVADYFRKKIADVFGVGEQMPKGPNTAIQDLENFEKYKQKSVQATIARQTIVFDASWSKSIHPTSSGISPETQVTVGISFLKNLGGDASKDGTFIHLGVGEGLNAGSSIPGSWLSPTLSFGFVHGKYEKVWDYRGGFIDESADIDGFGIAYCYWPGGAKATSFTFNPTDLAATIAKEGVPNVSGAIRVDYYLLLNKKEGGPSIEDQLGEFQTFVNKTWKGENQELNQALGEAFDWMKNNGK